MLQEQREKHEADSASRLQKQAKGIQIKFILLYCDTYDKYNGIIMFFGRRTMVIPYTLGMHQ